MSDPTDTYGVKRTDTDAVITADDTAMTVVSAGVYEHTFTEPADDLTYSCYMEFVYEGLTYYLETEVTGGSTGELTGLSVGYEDLTAIVAKYLGWTEFTSSTEFDALSANKRNEVDSIVQAGYRQFLWPPPLPLPKPPEGMIVHESAVHLEKKEDRIRWSFLEPVATIAITNGTGDYTLPTDFSGVLNSLTYEEDTDLEALVAVPEDHLRTLRASDDQDGDPVYYAVRPKSSDSSAIQRWELLLYPKPDESKNLLARYVVAPGALSAENPYPYGGPAHAETLTESCLAVAEERTADKSGAHRERFFALLASSVQLDKSQQEKLTTATWPIGDAGATTLDVTYDVLLKRVAHELGLSWNDATWSTEERRKIDMLVHQGLRQFYTPPPLPKEKYSHEWSFLKPTATLSTIAPYDTGTVTVVDGVVTLSVDGTFPSWAAEGTFTASGYTAVSVASRDGDNQITLSDLTIDVDAGTSYSLAHSAAYDLPTDFAAIMGPLTYEPSVNLLYNPIEVVSERIVRRQLMDNTTPSRMEIAAIRPQSIDLTAATTYEIVFCPIPDDAYDLTYRYKVNVAALGSTNVYPPGGQPHAETILESCLAACERYRYGKDGVHAARFKELLVASVSADQKAALPDSLGYDRELGTIDPWVWWPLRHYYSDNLVTHEGRVA